MKDLFLKMRIRNAHHSDIAALSELAMLTYSAAFGHTFRPADLTAHLQNNLSPDHFARILNEDAVLLAEIESRLIGYVQLGAANPSSIPNFSSYHAPQELRRLYVHPNFQNQGHGGAVMEATLRHPRLNNAACIFLDVWEHNHGAQQFYKRFGFKVVGTRAFEVESGAETSPDLIMARRILPEE